MIRPKDYMVILAVQVEQTKHNERDLEKEKSDQESRRYPPSYQVSRGEAGHYSDGPPNPFRQTKAAPTYKAHPPGPQTLSSK